MDANNSGGRKCAETLIQFALYLNFEMQRRGWSKTDVKHVFVLIELNWKGPDKSAHVQYCGCDIWFNMCGVGFCIYSSVCKLHKLPKITVYASANK